MCAPLVSCARACGAGGLASSGLAGLVIAGGPRRAGADGRRVGRLDCSVTRVAAGQGWAGLTRFDYSDPVGCVAV